MFSGTAKCLLSPLTDGYKCTCLFLNGVLVLLAFACFVVHLLYAMIAYMYFATIFVQGQRGLPINCQNTPRSA